MSLERLGAVSDPGRGDRANEDGHGMAGAFAWVIDGATGLGERRLMPGDSDAAWLTGTLCEALREGAGRLADPQTLLAHAAARAAKRFVDERLATPERRYEVPTAAILLARFSEDGVTLAELGDCALYLRAEGVLTRYGGTEEGRALEKANARAMMGSGQGRTPEVLAMLRSVRDRANTPEGYPIFAPEEGCAARARLATHPARAGDALLLTDGYEAAVEDYGLYTPHDLMEAAKADLAAPLAAMREVERSDPDCVRFPRFKTSDDATALLVRFEATPSP